MRYTSHIEDCLQSLAVANEYNADFILVQMVKLQKIVEDIRCSALHSASSMKGLVDLYVKAFQKSLQDYMAALPPGLQQNSEYFKLRALFIHIITHRSIDSSALPQCRDSAVPSRLSDASSRRRQFKIPAHGNLIRMSVGNKSILCCMAINTPIVILHLIFRKFRTVDANAACIF